MHPVNWANRGDYDLPPGLLLVMIKTLDSIPVLSGFWRDIIPFGWADPPYGIFSHRVGDLKLPSLKEYDEVPGGLIEFFSASDTVLGDLTHPTSLLIVLVIAFLIHTVKFMIYPYFEEIAKNLASKTHGKQWVAQNPERIYKFAEYCFRLIYHSSLSIYGIWLFTNNDWWHTSNGGTWNYFIDFPNHVLKPDMIWYCLIQAGYNVDAMVSLLLISFSVNVDLNKFPFVNIRWAKSVRGDFQEMFIHHIITNALTFGGSCVRLSRIEASFLLLHDISDIPVDLSKLSNFLKWKITTTVCFLIMCIVWLITRLLILPFVVFRSICFESHAMLIEKALTPEIYFCYRTLFVPLCVGIITLHMLWFTMFLKIFRTFLLKGEQHDYSEHKSGERIQEARKKI